MAGNRAIKISVLANTRQFKKELRNLGEVSGFRKLRSGLGKVGEALKKVTMLGAAATATIAAAGIKAASDLEQSTGTIDDIFKQHAGTVHAFAKSAAKDVGLSSNAYNELSAIISTQLKNGGTAMDNLAAKSNDLIRLGADLSAGFGGSTTDAVNAISSALKGERDPIEKYGVSLKQASIDAKAAALGFKKVGNSFDNQAQQAATLALIMEQTSDFHGKFARENDTLAHKVQVLKAQFTNISATLGSYLIPMITAVTGWVSDHLQPAFEKASGWVKANLAPAIADAKAKFMQWLPTLKATAGIIAGKLWQGIKTLASFIKGTVIPVISSLTSFTRQHSTLLVGIAGFIGGVVAAYKTYKITMAAVKVVTTGFAAAQAALNVVMNANPIGIVIMAIAGLVAGFVALWNYSEGFRNFWIGLWQSITGAVNAVITWFTETVPEFFSSAIQSIIGFFSGLFSSISGIFSGITSTISGAISGIVGWFGSLPGRVGSYVSQMATGVSNKIGDVVGYFKNLPSRILGALGNLGSLLLGAGKSVINGFVDGIKSAFGWVKDTLSSLTDWLPDWKGPARRDATILRKSGQLVIGGFVDGLENSYRRVKKSLGGFTRALPSMIDADLNSSLSLTPGELNAVPGTTIINIEFKTLDTSIEAGRKLANLIADYQRHSGRTTQVNAR